MFQTTTFPRFRIAQPCSRKLPVLGATVSEMTEKHKETKHADLELEHDQELGFVFEMSPQTKTVNTDLWQQVSRQATAPQSSPYALQSSRWPVCSNHIGSLLSRVEESLSGL